MSSVQVGICQDLHLHVRSTRTLKSEDFYITSALLRASEPNSFSSYSSAKETVQGDRITLPQATLSPVLCCTPGILITAQTFFQESSLKLPNTLPVQGPWGPLITIHPPQHSNLNGEKKEKETSFLFFFLRCSQYSVYPLHAESSVRDQNPRNLRYIFFSQELIQKKKLL